MWLPTGIPTMTSSTKLFSLVLALGLAACGSSDSNSDAENGGPGGKADDVEDIECAPASELRLELVGRDANESVDGDQLTNSVTATCFNTTGFENSECCAEVGLFEAYEEATSCTEQVVLSAPEGDASAQRCRDAASGSFVSSACCSDICDPEATFNASDRCVDSNGQFEDTLCCFLANSLDADSCEGAVWETLSIDGEERMGCRNQDSGQFAMNSCCAAECVQAISEEEFGVDSIPAACDAAVDLETPEAECPDLSTENVAGICHNPDNGQFVKAACCEAKGSEATICDWELDAAFGKDQTGDFLDAEVAEFEDILDVDAVGGLAGVQRDQVIAAALHLSFLLPGQELSNDDLFEVTDDGYYLTSVTVEGVSYDWVQFYAGDNEVGAFFEAGTDRMIAEVSDGDIMGCAF